MPKSVRSTLIALLFVCVLVAAWPWLALAVYGLRLAGMPAPATLAMPVLGVKRGALSDTWHAARAPRRRHEGIDIFAGRGTPVVAATEGIVLRRGQDPLGGNVVWVYGPGGLQHYYAHLDCFANLRTGDRVRAGTPLGFVGNTGNARTTPPHLHFGVYGDGGAVNPYPLLVHLSDSSMR